MESFFALSQNSVLDRQSSKSRDDLTVAVNSWIETTCHRRRQRGPGRMNPIAFETETVRLTVMAA